MVFKIISIMSLTFFSCVIEVGAQPTVAGGSVVKGGALPACVGSEPDIWDNCIGSFTYSSGNTYTGEYRRGMLNGKGKIRILNKGQSNEYNIASDIPSTYVGQFANNRINGFGVWTTDKGQKFEGRFVNNILVQSGKFTNQQIEKMAQDDLQRQQAEQLALQQAQQQAHQQAQQEAARLEAQRQQKIRIENTCNSLRQQLKQLQSNANSLQSALADASAWGSGGASGPTAALAARDSQRQALRAEMFQLQTFIISTCGGL